MTASPIVPDRDDSGLITEPEAERLLGVLCVKFGFCLQPLWHARLLKSPPKSVGRFTDTVFQAEGLDPATADQAMYREMYEEVRGAFERSAQSTVGVSPNDALERVRDP